MNFLSKVDFTWLTQKRIILIAAQTQKEVDVSRFCSYLIHSVRGKKNLKMCQVLASQSLLVVFI